MSSSVLGRSFRWEKAKERKKTTGPHNARSLLSSLSFLLSLPSPPPPLKPQKLKKLKNRTAWTIDAEAKALRHVSASTAALIYSSEPLWGAAFAALFLGERLQGVGGWVGAALVVGSSLVSQVGGAAGKGGRKGGEEGSAREKR